MLNFSTAAWYWQQPNPMIVLHGGDMKAQLVGRAQSACVKLACSLVE